MAQALLLAASALLPTLAASGPRKRRVETARRSACATTAPVKLFLRCHSDVGIDGYGESLAALLTSPLVFALWVGAAAFLDTKRRREEAWLLEQYGGYADYRRRVRRKFIPFVW